MPVMTVPPTIRDSTSSSAWEVGLRNSSSTTGCIALRMRNGSARRSGKHCQQHRDGTLWKRWSVRRGASRASERRRRTYGIGWTPGSTSPRACVYSASSSMRDSTRTWWRRAERRQRRSRMRDPWRSRCSRHLTRSAGRPVVRMRIECPPHR
ncbi:hypothetical protein OH76DRAFT_958698 [Lentinus brumalis]|uniref:Uncharacterized protein n=1 Tax=Lentinus brumalis TaxID=2498619 RepID=A0A371DPG2_9APHY|nr:hypothetical protein OH76DRAFT_958698 [Polyporus brumalis]